MRRRTSALQTAPADVINLSTIQHHPRYAHAKSRTQGGPGTRPIPSSPRPLYWRAGVYFGTPSVAYAQETGQRVQHRQRPQYGTSASRRSPPKFPTMPHPSTRKPAHSRRPTDAQVIAARYRSQKPLPPTPVSSAAAMSLGTADSLFVHPALSMNGATQKNVGNFPDPRVGAAQFMPGRPRVEERYLQEAYPQMMASWYEGHNFIRCPRPRCREAFPTLLDLAWHLQIHDYKSQYSQPYGWPATPRNPRTSVFETDLSGYYPRFSAKRLGRALQHFFCLLTCTRCCRVCSYDP